MKFTILETKPLYGAAALKKNFFDKKKKKKDCPTCDGWGKILKDKGRQDCPDCKSTKAVKEATLSGSGFPASNKSVDKAPTGFVKKLARRKKKIKTIMAKRVLPTI